MGELENALILVTGGGSGIGRAVCELASERGARVVIADVDLDTAQETLALLKGQNGRHLVVQTDVSSVDSVEALGKQIQEHYGEVPSGVVHCAGIVRNLDGIKGCTPDIFDKVIAVNLRGTYTICRHFSLTMLDKGIKGSLVIISSVADKGHWMAPAYSATKAGQLGLVKALSKEMARHGIRVNAIRPGRITTRLLRDMPAEFRETEQDNQHLPMDRPGTPREVAEACIFLVSNRSSYVTGTGYCVHGGLAEVPGPEAIF